MLKFAITLIKSQYHQCLKEVEETLDNALQTLGYDCILTDNLNLTDRQYIIIGAHTLCMNPLEIPRNSIIYNSEQIYADSPWLKSGYLDYLSQYSIWDYSLANINVLKRWQISDVQYLPIGYVPQLTRIATNKQKDIDVLFYGSINDRRQNIINSLEEKGIKVQVLFGVYGKQRDDYIARAKIVLNMHFYEAQVFEIVRVSYLLANQVFVISEKGSNSQESEYLATSLVFSDYENLVDCCLDYLTKEKQRKQIAKTGFELMKSRPATEFVKNVIPTIESSSSTQGSPQFVRDFHRKKQAQVYLDCSKFSEAIALYEQSLQVDVDCLESYWYLGLAFLGDGNDLAAELTWSAGIDVAVESGKNLENVIFSLEKVLEKYASQQIELNNHNLAEQIRLHLEEIKQYY